jgi:hypothetical protein
MAAGDYFCFRQAGQGLRCHFFRTGTPLRPAAVFVLPASMICYEMVEQDMRSDNLIPADFILIPELRFEKSA